MAFHELDLLDQTIREDANFNPVDCSQVSVVLGQPTFWKFVFLRQFFSKAMSGAGKLPSGVFPTMITPFTEDGTAIDWTVVDGAEISVSIQYYFVCFDFSIFI